jgi:hypothetical protein
MGLFVHPRNRRCLPTGQNPLKGEPKPPVFPRIRESTQKTTLLETQEVQLAKPPKQIKQC